MMVVGDDWNVVPSNLLVGVNPDLIDCTTVPNTINAKELRVLAEANNLEDIYRMKHTDQRSYTFKHFSGRRAARSRLDFFLKNRQEKDPRKPNFNPRILSRLCNSFDHRAIELNIVKKSYNSIATKRQKAQTIANEEIVMGEAAAVLFAASLAAIAGITYTWWALVWKISSGCWKYSLRP